MAVPADGCVKLGDTEEWIYENQIVLIDRGPRCTNYLKARNAWLGGAAAVIVVNHEMGEVQLAGNYSLIPGFPSQFPVLSVTQTDGAKLKHAAGTQASIRIGVHVNGDCASPASLPSLKLTAKTT